MKVGIFYLPSMGSREEMTRGMAGLRDDLYQRLLRDVVVVDSDAEAQALWRNSGVFCGAAWFRPFGFDRVLYQPGEEETFTAQDMLERALGLVGSPDTVSRQMEQMLAQAPVDYLFAWTYNALVPHAQLMRSLELFATKVLPHFAA